MCLAIGHLEGRVAVLDLVDEQRPPFSPEEAATRFIRTLRSYGCTAVQADRHLRGVLEGQFIRQGIRYDTSAPAKSILFDDLIARISSRSVRLLDLQALREQVLALEPQGISGGYEKIGVPRQREGRALRDDIANACAGVLALAGGRERLSMFSEAVLGRDRGSGFPMVR